MRRVGAFAALRFAFCVLLRSVATRRLTLILIMLTSFSFWPFAPWGLSQKKRTEAQKQLNSTNFASRAEVFYDGAASHSSSNGVGFGFGPGGIGSKRARPDDAGEGSPHPRMCTIARARAPAIAACKLADLHMHFALRTTHNRAWAIGPPGDWLLAVPLPLGCLCTGARKFASTKTKGCECSTGVAGLLKRLQGYFSQRAHTQAFLEQRGKHLLLKLARE